MIDTGLRKSIKSRLDFIYKDKVSEKFLDKLFKLIEENAGRGNEIPEKWNEKDMILITYGDMVVENGKMPLRSLRDFLVENLREEISVVHILPFFPYSSDDGFSVTDYTSVNPNLGDWGDIKNIRKKFDLMVDLVINHISQHSEWFRNYLKGRSPGKDYFIEADPKKDHSMVVRPRSLPLLTRVETSSGMKHVWTTFSSDQIDLNFSNPEVFYEMIRVLLLYIKQGARAIRLDAIAFLWKEPGTSCIHLPQTHEIVKLMREIAEAVNPEVIIITETNVPNEENLSYFGDGDEAHMVYQFSLPPLLLHALYSGNAEYLVKWAKTLPDLPPRCTFFNFTASHDGIGVRPLEGLLPGKEINQLIDGMKAQGGRVSSRRKEDGTESPYELNITYFDALKHTRQGRDDYHVDRFITSQIIMMGMKGIPAFYFHSFTGTENYYEGVEKTGSPRSVNRKKWNYEELLDLLSEDTPQARVFYNLKRLSWIRKHQKAFHPDADQQILDLGNSFFGFKRTCDEQVIYAISNVTNQNQYLEFDDLAEIKKGDWTDLLTGAEMKEPKAIMFDPYRTVWLEKMKDTKAGSRKPE